MARKICDNCTGCGACSCVCPKNCIAMQENRLAEITPIVDMNVCNECGLCRKICPQNNPIKKIYPEKCYVAWSKNEDDLRYSSSGGVAATFARYQLNKGNKIYGCDYDDNYDLVHFLLTNKNDIFRMQSSKYSQSNSFLVFKQIKKELNDLEQVVFVGTPCQVAGLKSYLVKDYRNLITVDLVCHGTPPNRYFKEHINKVKNECLIDKIRFRGEYDQKLTLWESENIVYQKHYSDDLYFSAFYKNKISRNSCYSCQYAQSKRISDITLADFWGLGELNNIKKMSDRPSLILLNTDQGKLYFEDIKNMLIYEERTVEEAIEGNGRLNRPPGKSIEAKSFQKLYLITSFPKAVKFSEKINNCVEYILKQKIKLKKFTKRVKKAINRRLKDRKRNV